MKIQQVAILVITMVTAPAALAGGAVKHSVAALELSLQAVGNATVGGLKLVSAAAAVPFTVAGEIGKASGIIGEGMWDFAERTEPDMFPVSSEIVTAGPDPRTALEQQDGGQ